MHYFVYLDEFGHIGQFLSRSHEKFNSSPVFVKAPLAVRLLFPVQGWPPGRYREQAVTPTGMTERLTGDRINTRVAS